MRAGLLTIAALTAVAAAQPHRRHAHAHKRQDVDVVTEYAPAVVVYVDQNGNPIPASAAPTPAAAAPAPPPAYAAAPVPAPAPAPAAPAPAAPAPAAAPPSYTPSSTNSTGYGIAYSPYNDDGTCKSQDEVNADFADFEGYGLVRFYGCDCNQATTVITAAKAKGMKVMAGIFDITQVAADVQSLIAAVNGDWSTVETVSVGNELVNNGGSVADVVAAVNTARSLLQAGGFNGSVVTVDTFVAIIANPELCQCSDYAAANIHAFFDGGKTADQAGQFVADQVARVAAVCGGKKVVVTETGWPWCGDNNGVAVPSKENQAAAISSIKSQFTENVILFTAYDDTWKMNNAATFGAEQYWGFIKQSS